MLADAVRKGALDGFHESVRIKIRISRVAQLSKCVAHFFALPFSKFRFCHCFAECFGNGSKVLTGHSKGHVFIVAREYPILATPILSASFGLCCHFFLIN